MLRDFLRVHSAERGSGTMLMMTGSLLLIPRAKRPLLGQFAAMQDTGSDS